MSPSAHTGAGGAATHSGVDFQQRMAAWFAVAMWAQLDVGPTLGVANTLYVDRISMETADSIDDFVLTCQDDYRALIQAKASPALSESVASDFGSAIRQFVQQHQQAPRSKDVYVLAVAPSASSKIRHHLRKLLLAIRYDPTSWTTAPLSEADKEVFETFRRLVRVLSTRPNGNAWSDDELIAFAQRVHVATFDMDDSGSDCRSAYILLHALARLNSPPDLVWSRLVQLCLHAARQRLSLSRAGLQDALTRFVDEAEVERADQAFYQLVEKGP